jgi:uncharacterized membrane protein YraQ (UPF0718 family)
MTDATINQIWVVLFRTIQTLLDASPTLLCGLFISGIMRGMIGPDALRKWFTNDPLIGPVRAWLIGLLIPVCSFGVLPIAWELKRAGVRRASVITFLFSAPLAHPFSLIDGFQRLEGAGPWGIAVITAYLVGSFAITVGLGILLGKWMAESVVAVPLPPLPKSGSRRVGVSLLTVARGLTSNFLGVLIIGVLGAGMLAVISGGALERAMNDRSATAPVHLAWVSTLFQTPASRGMSLVCEALISGVSVGRGFEFFLLGIGIHLGTIVWISWAYGFRILACTVAFVVCAALIVGSATPVSLNVAGSGNVKDCHFLEIELSGGFKVAKARLIRTTITNDAEEFQWPQIAACATLAVLWLAGVGSMFFGERGSASYWMIRDVDPSTTQTATIWSTSISAQQRMLIGVVVVLVCTASGLYIYYPPPVDLLNQMEEIQIEFASALRTDPQATQKARPLLIQWKRLQNKFVVATLLRHGRTDPQLKVSIARLGVVIDGMRMKSGETGSAEDLKALLAESRELLSQSRKLLERHPEPRQRPVLTP